MLIFAIIVVINIYIYQNSLKMQENQVVRQMYNKPIRPLPVYFSRQNQDSVAQYDVRLFQMYCQYAKNGLIFPNQDVVQIQKQHKLSEDFSNLNQPEQERYHIKTQENEIQIQQQSSLKGEQELQKSGSRYRQQKNYYNKFLQRSTANDTKNIPKNFGKAIISFIQKNQRVTARCLRKHNISIQLFIKQLKIKKKILHSIRQLRSLWINNDFVYAKPFRQLSFYFLRRAGHRYIFGSRVSDFGNHLKYRYRIMYALRCPHTFSSIKI